MLTEITEEILDKVMKEKNFHHVCQPLYDLKNWQVFGYEVLIRCELFENPEQLFKCAMQHNRLYELDTSSILHATLMNDHFSSMWHTKWFINVYPSTLIHPSFHSILKRLGEASIPGKNLVFEINEIGTETDLELLKRAVKCLKTKYAVALDDVGKGEATLRAIIELEPDYIKLDRYFSVGLSASAAKQKLIRTLVEFCRDSNICLVLEGIEESEDLAIAKALGIHVGQGFLLGKPAPMNRIRHQA